MASSKQLAKLIGLTITIVTISEMINYHIWDVNDPQVIYMNGMVLFVAGLAIVLRHNLWVRDWRLVITLIGWSGILLGLFRLFFPEMKQAPDNIYTFAAISFLLAVGIFLTVKGYSREKSKPDDH